MRVLTLSCEYPPVGGGGATACRLLAEALAEAGHEVDVVTARMPGLPAREEQGGVRLFRAAGFRRHRHHSSAAEQASFVPPMLRQADRLARERRYDVAHCHFVVPTGLVAGFLRRRHGLPYVLTAHGSDVPGYNPQRFAVLHRLIAPAWRGILRDAAAVTSPSHFLARLLQEGFDLPVEVIPNPLRGVSQPRAADAARLLVVSRLVERKGVQFVIEALAACPRDWELLVVGDGPYRPELRRLAAALGVNATFTGHLPREELPSIYASTRIFVLPSLRENFPMVLLEAMAAGCAVVTTDVAGCAELVGDAGRLVPPGDAAALRRTFQALLADPLATAELGRRARARAAQFEAATVAARFAALFERCRQRSAASRPMIADAARTG